MMFFVFIFVGVAFFSFVSADVISVNYGGSDNLIVDGGLVESFFFSPESVEVSVPVCGNGVLESGEACDDGNLVSNDGCSASCVVDSAIPVATPGGGGGGGGGAISTVVANDTKLVSTISYLSAVPESLNLPATVGIQTKAKLSLINSGDSDFNLTWSVVALEKMINFDAGDFVLKSGETKILEFFIMPEESGIHTGKFVFTSSDGALDVPIVLNTNSELSLFDIMLDLSEAMRVISVGDRVTGQISLVQMGLKSDVDVAMNYVIKDFSGRTYLTQTETIKVNGEKSYPHTFETGNLPPGDYIVGAEIIYAGGIATASSQFLVKDERFFPWRALVIVLIIVLVVVVISAKLYKKGK